MDKEKLSQLDKLSQTFKLVSVRDGETTVSLNSIRSHLRLSRGGVSARISSAFASEKAPSVKVSVKKPDASPQTQHPVEVKDARSKKSSKKLSKRSSRTLKEMKLRLLQKIKEVNDEQVL